jgi:hypothetical protein
MLGQGGRQRGREGGKEGMKEESRIEKTQEAGESGEGGKGGERGEEGAERRVGEWMSQVGRDSKLGYNGLHIYLVLVPSPMQ